MRLLLGPVHGISAAAAALAGELVPTDLSRWHNPFGIAVIAATAFLGERPRIVA